MYSKYYALVDPPNYYGDWHDCLLRVKYLSTNQCAFEWQPQGQTKANFFKGSVSQLIFPLALITSENSGFKTV